MHFFPNYGFGLHRLIYVSRSTLPPETLENELAAIVAASSRRNRQRSVTGALVAYDRWFIQALEGTRDVVQPLFERIAADPRHAEVRLVSVEPTDKRLFARWGMRQGAAPAGAVFNIGSASEQELLALLKLSAMAGPAKAA